MSSRRAPWDGFDPLARRMEMLGFMQLASEFFYTRNLKMQFIYCRGGIMMLNAPYLDAYPFRPQPETHDNRLKTPY